MSFRDEERRDRVCSALRRLADPILKNRGTVGPFTVEAANIIAASERRADRICILLSEKNRVDGPANKDWDITLEYANNCVGGIEYTSMWYVYLELASEELRAEIDGR